VVDDKKLLGKIAPFFEKMIKFGDKACRFEASF